MEKRSKYNVSNLEQKRSFNGIVFDSEMEMRYYVSVILPAMQRGEIVRCEQQKVYTLQPKFRYKGKAVQPIEYKADFYIEYKSGAVQVIDVKGCADPVAKLKRKIFWYTYPETEYLWIGYSELDGGWVTYEKIQKGRKLRKKLNGNNKGVKNGKSKKRVCGKKEGSISPRG